MRRGSLAAIFVPLVALLSGQGPSKPQVPQLPNGTVSANTYTNEAVGVSYEIPEGWKATPDPEESMRLDTAHPDSPMNRCTKVLLWLTAPGEVEGKFNSVAALFVMDPACFSNPPFPQSLDKKAINKTVDKMWKPFTRTSFCSPYGATVEAFTSQGHVVISLVGAMTINAFKGKPSPRKEPLGVNTSFNFTELNGYWVGWAFVADRVSTAQLKNARVTLRDQSATPRH